MENTNLFSGQGNTELFSNEEEVKTVPPAEARQKAAFVALGTGRIEDYQEAVLEQETQGVSSKFEEMKAINKRENGEAALSVVESELSREVVSPEDASSLIEAYREVTGKKLTDAEAKEYVAMQRIAVNPEDLPVSVKEAILFKEKRLALKGFIDQKQKTETFGQIAEAVAESFVPLATTIVARDIAGIIGAEKSPSIAVTINNIREKLYSPDTSLEQKELVLEKLTALAKDAGIQENSWVTQNISEYIFEGFSETDATIESIFQVLEAVEVGVIVRGVARGIKALASNSSTTPPVDGNPIETVATTNTTESTALQQRAMDNQEAAEALSGTTPEGVLEYYNLPKAYDDGLEEVLDGAPMDSAVRKEYYEQLVNSKNLFDESSDLGGIGFSKSDIDANIERVRDTLLKTNTVTVAPNRTTIDVVDDVNMRVHVALNNTVVGSDGLPASGVFTTAREAFDKTSEFVNSQGAEAGSVKVYRVMPNGQHVEVKEITDEAGKFVSSADFVKPLSHKVAAPFENGWGSLIPRWFVDDLNSLNKRFVDFVSRSQDKATYIEAELLKPIGENIGKLSYKSKEKVLQKLADVQLKGKRSTYSDLIREGFDEAEIKGVFTAYRFQKLSHKIANRKAARDLRDEGAFMLNVGESTYFTNRGKYSVDALENAKTYHIYDPSSDSVMRLTKDEIKKQGIEISKLKTRLKDFEIDADFVSIPKNASFRPVRETDKVLREVVGHFRRDYKGDYFVFAQNKKTGEIRVVANSSDSALAQKKADELNTKDSDWGYFSRTSFELQKQLGRSVDEEMSAAMSGLSVERHRGKHLASIEDLDNSLDAKADISNAFESMVGTAMSVGRASQVTDVIDLGKAKFMATYGKYIAEKGGMKSFPKDFSEVNITSAIERRKAESIFNYIREVETTKDNYLLKQAYGQVLETTAGLADKIPEKLGGKQLSNMLRALRDGDIISAAKTFSFVQYIATNPDKFFILNAAQMLQFVPLSSKFKNPIRMANGSGLLWRAVLADPKDRGMLIEAYAKSTNTALEDAKALIENYSKSGIREGVSRNTMLYEASRHVGEEVYNSKTKRVLKGAGDVLVRKPIEISTKYGFNAGETLMVNASYMVSAERYSKQMNKPMSSFTKKDWEQVGADSTRLAWGMRKEHRFAYQNPSGTNALDSFFKLGGLTPVLALYAQVAHKASLFALSGNKVLTKEERLRLAGFNFVLLGSAGYFSEVFDPIMEEVAALTDSETAKDVVRFMRVGLLNSTINSTGDYILGFTGDEFDPTNVNFSKTISAYTDLYTNFSQYFESIGNASIADPTRSGAFMSGFYKAGTAIGDMASMVWSSSTSSEIDFEPDEFAKSFASIFSGFNNHWRAWLAFESGELRSASGKTVPVNAVEALLTGIGVKIPELEAYYKERGESYDRYQEAKELAKQEVEYIQRRLALSSDPSADSFGETQSAMYLFKRMKESLDPEQMITYNEEFYRLLNKRQEDMQDSLISMLMKNVGNGLMAEEVFVEKMEMIGRGDMARNYLSGNN